MSRSSIHQWRRLLALGGLGIALALEGCGQLCLFASDDSCDGPKLGSACPSGTILYRIPPGAYTASGSVVLSDTCTSGLTAMALDTTKVTIQDDTVPGNIVALVADGTELGRGPVRCNNGGLLAQDLALKNGMCSFSAQRVSSLNVWSDGWLSIKVTETRSDATGTCGAMPMKCELRYQLTLRL